MIKFIKVICENLKKQDKLVDYKIDDSLAINQEGKLIDIINIKIVSKRAAKHIKMKITLTPNAI